LIVHKIVFSVSRSEHRIKIFITVMEPTILQSDLKCFTIVQLSSGIVEKLSRTVEKRPQNAKMEKGEMATFRV
jgi:hypothetical protein